jgi:uncharacterized integral membrane protein (TIGR00698 family)
MIGNNPTMSQLTLQQSLSAPQALLAAAVLPALLWYGNPAVALLVGAALSLSFDKPVIPYANTLGKQALQTAIVLLGLKLNASQLLQISADYSVLVTCYVLLTIALGLGVGVLLGNQKKSSQLISSGTAICGGTTIASLSPVIGARPEQTGVALTLVFLLNALALFSFPVIGEYLALSQEQFGVWAALAIHDTSSVVATAALYGEEAATVATTVKLGRTLWLIPLLLVFSILAQRGSAKLRLPLFIVFFVLAASLGSLVELPAQVVGAAAMASKSLLVVALLCIGTEITRATLKELRGAVLVQGLLLWAIVVPVTLLLVRAL